MSTPLRNGGFTFKAGELDALMSDGMDPGEALAALGAEAASVVLDESQTSDDPQDEAGAYDYKKAEEEYRRSLPGRVDPRFRPLVKARDKAEDNSHGKAMFSKPISILVPEKAVFPKINFLCKQLGLAAGPPTLLIGISQSGKTFLAQDLALSVASGKPFLGSINVGKGQVVHIDYEQGQEQSRIRYLRLMKGKGLSPSDLTEGDLVLYRETKKLDEPGAEHELRNKLTGKALCIIDSLRASISGEKDENSSDFREPIDMLGRVSEETGCTVLILHHQGKGQVKDDRHAGRGSSAIFEAAGAAFSLDVTGTYPEKVYRLWQTKTRMGFAPELRYQLQDVGEHIEDIACSEGILLVPSAPPVKLSTEDRIKEVLREQGELGAEALSKAVAGKKEKVIEVRDKMLAEGVLGLKPVPRGRPVYFLVETGTEWGESEEV